MRWSTAPVLRRWPLFAAAVAATAWLVACAEDASPPADSGPPQLAPRIASLSPALTATVVRLGLGPRVVGRTPWCDSVDAAVPVVGSLTDFDAERLVRLAPTHVLVQPPRAGVDPGLERLAASRGWTLVVQPIDGIEDVKAAIAGMPAALAGGDRALETALAERAGQIVQGIDDGLRAATPDAAAASPVLLLFSLDPPMAFGSGSYLGDMLERLGGRNAIAATGYPQLSLEDIHRAAPRTILLVQASAGATSGAEGDPWAPLRALGLPAIVEGRCAVLRHPAAHTPGPDVAAVAAELVGALRRGATAGGTEAIVESAVEAGAGSAPKGGPQ